MFSCNKKVRGYPCTFSYIIREINYFWNYSSRKKEKYERNGYVGVVVSPGCCGDGNTSRTSGSVVS